LFAVPPPSYSNDSPPNYYDIYPDKIVAPLSVISPCPPENNSQTITVSPMPNTTRYTSDSVVITQSSTYQPHGDNVNEVSTSI